MKRECNECFTLFEAASSDDMFCSDYCITDFDTRLKASNEIVDKMLEENPRAINATRVQNNNVSASSLMQLIKTSTSTEKKDD